MRGDESPAANLHGMERNTRASSCKNHSCKLLQEPLVQEPLKSGRYVMQACKSKRGVVCKGTLLIIFLLTKN